MLAATLTIPLTGDRSVTTTGRADLACREHKIDVREHVVDAIRVVLDSARVHHNRRLCTAVEQCSVDDLLSRHTADLRGDVR